MARSIVSADVGSTLQGGSIAIQGGYPASPGGCPSGMPFAGLEFTLTDTVITTIG